MCHSFTHSLIQSSGTASTSAPQLRHERDRHVKILRFDSWISYGWFTVMAAHPYRHLAGHAPQPFNNSCWVTRARATENSAHFFRQFWAKHVDGLHSDSWILLKFSFSSYGWATANVLAFRSRPAVILHLFSGQVNS